MPPTSSVRTAGGEDGHDGFVLVPTFELAASLVLVAALLPVLIAVDRDALPANMLSADTRIPELGCDHRLVNHGPRIRHVWNVH